MNWRPRHLDDELHALGAGKVLALKATCCGRTVPGDMLRDYRALGLAWLCDGCESRIERQGRLLRHDLAKAQGAPAAVLEALKRRRPGE